MRVKELIEIQTLKDNEYRQQTNIYNRMRKNRQIIFERNKRVQNKTLSQLSYGFNMYQMKI